MTSVPRDKEATALAAQLKRRRYTNKAIAQELTRLWPEAIPHLTPQGAAGYVREGQIDENQAIAQALEDDPFEEPARGYILDRIRGRSAQAQTLDEIEQEAWQLMKAHPDITLVEISPTLKWVAAERRLLLGLSPVDDIGGTSVPPAPDPDLQRRFDAADPGV